MSGSFLIATAAWLGGAASAGGVVLNELHYHPPAGEEKSLEFIEVFNTGPGQVQLGGWSLQGGVVFTFPGDAALPAGGYAIVCRDRDLFLGFYELSGPGIFGNFTGSLENAGEEIVLVDAFNAHVDAVYYDDEAPWPVLADGGGASLERVCPTGASWDPRNWAAAEPPSPLAQNPSMLCPLPPYRLPAVVLSEIHYHPEDPDEVLPAGDDGEDLEYIELHNPGAAPVNLRGWEITSGISFSFPRETDLPLEAGGYLVVCRDPAALRAAFPGVNAVGPFLGKLANGGERLTLVDAAEAIVDSVRYGETGEWPYAPDGEGPSLEKIVLAAPGEDPGNWAANSVSGEAFRHLAVEGSLGPQPSQRVLLYIDGQGECIVDNIVIEDVNRPGINIVANGAFDIDPFLPVEGRWEKVAGSESSQSIWTANGGVGGSGGLRLISSGACPSGCTTLNSVSQRLPDGLDRAATFRVTMDVKYVGGSTAFRGGLLRGAAVKFVLQSPGAANGASALHAPPLVSHVRHFPQEPDSTEAVSVTAFVRLGQAAPGAPPGEPVPEVWLTRTGGVGPAPILPMFDDGQHRDGRAGDGVFGVQLPASPDKTQVRYRVNARDGELVGQSPRSIDGGSPLSRDVWGYYVNDLRAETRLPVYHILIDGIEDGSDWQAVNDHLNCDVLKPATFVYQGDLYPDVGVRFRGNTACVINKRNFKLVFNRGRLFRNLKKINLNGIWTDKSLVREYLSWEFLHEIGLPYSETEYVRLNVSGSYYGLFLYVEHPDERFLERNALDSEGSLYKAKQPPREPGVAPIGVAPHANADDYRRFWEEETNEGGDFSDLVDFVDSMHAEGRPGSAGSLSFWQARSFAEMMIGYQVGQVILNNIDSFAKNHFLYHDLRPGIDRWGFLTWDLDLTFGKFFTFCAVDPQRGRQVGTLNDIVLCDMPRGPLEECARRNFFLPPQLDPWFASSVVQPQVLNWLVDFFLRTGNGHHQRAYLKRLWDALEEKLNNAAYDPILDELAAFLAPEEEDDYQFWGRYPTNVPGFPERMYGANGLPGNIDLVKDQVRCHGTFLRDYILSSYPEIPALPRLKFTEIMYQPELGNQDLEFLEIVNFSGRPVDLSLWTIEDGIHYVFPPGSIVADGEVFVVARNPQRFRNRYRGVSNRVFGPYEGKLADEGDRVCLRDAGPGHPATIDFVGYNNKGVWPELLPGQSLELTAVGPSRDNDRGQNWMASSAGGGTPGTTAALFRRADVNDDQILNLTDALFILNYLFLSGPTPSCMDAADTNDDGLHNLTDGVFLLTHLFLNGPPPPPPHPAAGPDPTPDPFGCLR